MKCRPALPPNSVSVVLWHCKAVHVADVAALQRQRIAGRHNARGAYPEKVKARHLDDLQLQFGCPGLRKRLRVNRLVHTLLQRVIQPIAILPGHSGLCHGKAVIDALVMAVIGNHQLIILHISKTRVHVREPRRLHTCSTMSGGMNRMLKSVRMYLLHEPAAPPLAYVH